jgi:hypothetical protein
MLRRSAQLRDAAVGWLASRRLQQQDPLAATFARWAGRDRTPVKKLTQDLRDELARSGTSQSVRSAHAALDRLRGRALGKGAFMNLHTAMTRALSFDHLDESIRFGEAHVHVFRDKRVIRSLVIFLRRAGEYQRALERLQDLDEDEWRAKYHDELTRLCSVVALKEKHTELNAAVAAGEDAFRALGEQIMTEVDEDMALLLLFQTAKGEFKKSKRLSQLVIDYGEQLAGLGLPPPRLAFDICDAQLHQGNITAALSALDRLGQEEDVASKRERVAAFARLGDDGFTHSIARDVADEWSSEPARVLVPLHNSLPYDSGGYASRTHGLLSNIAALGWKISGVTRLGYPQDRKKHRGSRWIPSSKVDAIAYFRLRTEGSAYGQIPIYDYLCSYADALYELCKRANASGRSFSTRRPTT